MKYKIRIILGLCVILFSVSACKKYLDIIPDNVATIDNAFNLRVEAEKYLFGLYSFLPKDGNPVFNLGFTAGDEIWIPVEQRELIAYAWQIARGAQNANNPYMNVWDGMRGANPGDVPGRYKLFTGIRNCNTFIENVSDLGRVRDLQADERSRWLGEAMFLKAYYHYYLLRMYGPIPIMDKNVAISADAEEVRVKRMPVDECVSYISSLLDSAASRLPPRIVNTQDELGRISQPIALALKAKLLLMAASPLFNGNTDYANFRNVDGTLFFNQTYESQKWEKAAQAAKAAIESAEASGASLYTFTDGNLNLSDTTITQLSIRNSFNERWVSEHIWANPNSTASGIQQDAMAMITTPSSTIAPTTTVAREHLAAPIKIAELFYTRNGVPITEDKTLDFTNKYTVRTAVKAERFNIKEGYQTARLNFDREPRFYADLGFDGGVWYKYDSPNNTDEGTYVLEGKATQLAGANNYGWFNETGYFLKKLVNYEQVFTSGGATYKTYPWPEIRLPDIYLAYAEALNEFSGPSDEVFKYLDLIRNRAGIPGVKESWTNFSTSPTKFNSKEGLRDIIQQERAIELAFEGNRYWDQLRWKKAVQSMNQTITGWSIRQSATADYYRIRSIYPQTFVAPRDYFAPIRNYNMTVNPNLVQNPGW